MTRLIFLTIWLSLITSSAYTQEKSTNQVLSKQHLLSINETGHELDLKTSFDSTLYPTGNIRSIAEFEPVESVLVVFDNNDIYVPYHLLSEISKNSNLITIVRDSTTFQTAIEKYLYAGIDTAKCNFLFTPVDSYWCRDYCPLFIAVNDTVSLINFPYNRPRPNDNNIPLKLAEQFNFTLYGMNLSMAGGNWMTDGINIAASTDLIYSENSDRSLESIDTLVKKYLGIDTYHINIDPLEEYIRHIDCWGKFLAVDKILITQVAETDSRYNAYEALAKYWSHQTCSYGYPFKVYRIYADQDQPYANSLIVNNKIFVPLVSGSGSSLNNDALETYQQAMSGYEVIGIEEKTNAPWFSTDALHCRLHEIPDRNMIHIFHTPYKGEFQKDEIDTLKAKIIAYSGKPIIESILHYQIDDNIYNELPMVKDSNNYYLAILPSQSEGSRINYYITAKDLLGRLSVCPFSGKNEPYSFSILKTTSKDVNIKHDTTIRCYPTPTKNVLHISGLNDQSEYNIQLVGINGRIYKDLKSKNTIRLNDLSNGVYLLKISSEDETIIKKIIINH